MSTCSVGIFYGSTTGNTRRIAADLAALLEQDGWATAEPLDVADIYLDEMRDFDLLLLGMPTWSVGQMQRDWQAVFEELDALELTGRPVALFGLGDQVGYPDTFADALAFLADKLQERGAHLFGAWPADGYTFTSSWALRPDGHFVGLILDEENQPHLTTQRCTEWIAALRAEYLQHVRAAPGLPAQSA